MSFYSNQKNKLGFGGGMMSMGGGSGFNFNKTNKENYSPGVKKGGSHKKSIFQNSANDFANPNPINLENFSYNENDNSESSVF